MTDPSSRLDDFLDTAAVMSQLDLVITADTSVAHLAGALGIPVWVVLPYDSDWRWLSDREDSPWYPTMKLFRQRKWGDWDEVFNRINGELGAMIATRESRSGVQCEVATHAREPGQPYDVRLERYRPTPNPSLARRAPMPWPEL